ncbi:hypothetical protein CLAIMM_01588, partial [Cladophialophora immunda]
EAISPRRNCPRDFPSSNTGGFKDVRKVFQETSYYLLDRRPVSDNLGTSPRQSYRQNNSDMSQTRPEPLWWRCYQAQRTTDQTKPSSVLMQHHISHALQCL